ncbi:related to 1-acyl-sn-glycerol-3-phosphate acyltransferase [Ramularia collo-cygni]|uniref:1-acyl-sn-glycerol-3-phosphate acyltransferase n=1 Tax=Ramularia collo-cygni TaxID=112498 RepID=A0A2D3UTL0_9PEZI|nr:related to 1-acyl-sn-glycerol-3-phosphate acyltransferase [Ramularia collo-cygni]CZT15187.1 related to 1-acyl-sn-glycerol-3-phosphate acyltransferase [Ramularia collo-cygni]
MAFLFYLLTATTVLTLSINAFVFLGSALGIPALTFYARSLASIIAMLLAAGYGVFASAALSLFGKGGMGQWTTGRAFKWLMLLFTGVWFDVQDPEEYLSKTRPAVFVGNHQTELDVLMLGHIFPRWCSVTAKKSLSKVPVLGWFMLLSKTVFIERKSREQALQAFDNAAKQMREERQSVFIFPEGTRSYYDKPDMLAFKKGAFHLAVQAQVPIVPVVVANYSEVMDFKRKLFVPGSVPVRVLKPIPTKGKTKEDVDDLLKEVREVMLAALVEITEVARREGVAKKQQDVGNGKAVTPGSNFAGKAMNAAA